MLHHFKKYLNESETPKLDMNSFDFYVEAMTCVRMIVEGVTTPLDYIKRIYEHHLKYPLSISMIICFYAKTCKL